MIKNIIFDLAGVLLNLDLETDREALASVGLPDFYEFHLHPEVAVPTMGYLNGLIGEEEFVTKVLPLCKEGTTREQLLWSMDAVLGDIPVERLEMLVSLRKRYKVYLLSNLYEKMWHYVVGKIEEKGYKVEDLFDIAFLSYEMKLAKPDASIFHAVFERTGIKPEETLYFDDSRENIEGGRRVGLHSVLVPINKIEDVYTDIFIDFDDTLYDTRGNSQLALEEIYEEFNLRQYFDKPEDFYVPYWNANAELWAQYSRGEIKRDYLIVERFRRPLSQGKGLEPTVEYCLKVSDRFLELCSCKPGTLPGAHELCQYLKAKGYRLHLASNGFHEVQYRKIKAAGMDGYFDSVILSEDAGVNKPAKEFFDYALQQTGAVREMSIMIGDNYNTDILGAMNGGIDTLLYKRWDKDFVPPQPVNYAVDALSDIMNIL